MRIFDEATRAGLNALRVSMRRAFAGDAGLGAQSRRRGGRTEFEDHRPYAAGDDFKSIDWSLYGRLEQLYVKRFRAETDLEIHVVVDQSASMALGHPPKVVAALRLAAAFAFAFAGEGRRIRLWSLRQRLEPATEVVRGEGDAMRMLARLETLEPPEGRCAFEALSEIDAHSQRTRFTVLISDLLEDGAAQAALAMPRPTGSDLLVIAMHSAHERRLTPEGSIKIVGAEGEGAFRMMLDDDVASNYAVAYERYYEEMRRAAAKSGASFVEAAAEETFDAVFPRALRRSGLT